MPNSPLQLDAGKIVLAEPLSRVRQFLKFCTDDIYSAIEELEKISSEKNRKHLQRLVYTNLVNRFDVFVDRLLIWSGINNPILREELFKKMSDDPISKKELFKLLYMRDAVYEIINKEILETVQSQMLSQAHYVKVRKLMVSVSWSDMEKRRVNDDGQILAKRKHSNTTPNTVLGYADWLYIRRNSLVHGEGSKYAEKDHARLMRDYGTKKLSKTFKLSVGSIKSAARFYQDFATEYGAGLEASQNGATSEESAAE